MGISHILFFYYKFNEAWKFALWSFTSYFLMTFQGFFVAVLYCFLNGEVRTRIKNTKSLIILLARFYIIHYCPKKILKNSHKRNLFIFISSYISVLFLGSSSYQKQLLSAHVIEELWLHPLQKLYLHFHCRWREQYSKVRVYTFIECLFKIVKLKLP